jgi:anthranilate synthase component 2
MLAISKPQINATFATYFQKVKLLIIDNYDSFTYNLVQLVEQAGVSDYLLVKNDQLLDLKSEAFDKVIISPGPGIAEEAGELMQFLKMYYQKKNMLGICLGYEALAELFGGKLAQMPEPMHGIRNKGRIVKKDNIFKDLPAEFFIGHYHSWIIQENGMPDKLEILMKDENGLPMAFKHNTYALTGLQFHPESVMTDFGLEMIRNWLQAI